MGIKNKSQWIKGWELRIKQHGKYVEFYLKRPKKDFHIYSGRLGPYGLQVKFMKSDRGSK